MRFTSWYVWLCVCEILLLCACTSSSSLPSRTTNVEGRPEANHQQQQKDPDLLSDPVAAGFFNGTPAGEREAWLRFIKDGQYRTANTSDFRFPEAAKRLQGNDLEKAAAHPYVGGDINHDGAFHDFAVIVVDTKQKDPARFSVMIFTQPMSGKDAYDTHWLYRDRDLSRTALEWWSGGLALREYREDGSYEYCRVNWDQRVNAYRCDKT